MRGARIQPRAPATAYWIARNQDVLPGHACGILQDAGMLQASGDDVIRYYYRVDRQTPYGSLRDNILY